jgi:hypothetical protein
MFKLILGSFYPIAYTILPYLHIYRKGGGYQAIFGVSPLAGFRPPGPTPFSSPGKERVAKADSGDKAPLPLQQAASGGQFRMGLSFGLASVGPAGSADQYGVPGATEE